MLKKMLKSTAIRCLLIVLLIGGFVPLHPSTAQGPYVSTFDLNLPVKTGTYKDVNPRGVKITWWHNHTKAREAALKTAVDQFNKSNPWGITVDPVSKGRYPEIYQAMLAGIIDKTVPALIVAYAGQAAQYQLANALVDLDVFVKDNTLGLGADFDGDFYSSFLASDVNSQLGNQRLGMPVYRSMEVLYYNVDALKALGASAPPKTWDDFKQLACQYVQANPGADGFQVRVDASFIAAATFAQGADIYDTKADRFKYDEPAAKLMPQAMQDMVSQGCAKPLTDPASGSDEQAFIDQAALFYIDSTSSIPSLTSSIQGLKKPFKWDAAAIPYGERPVQNVYGASVSVPRTTPEQELAAWLFLRWYTETQQQVDWATATSYFPVRRSTKDGLQPVFEKNQPYLSAFNLLNGETKAEPPIAAYEDIRTLASAAFEGLIVDTATSVDGEFDRMNGDVNETLKRLAPSNVTLPTPKPTTAP